MIEGGQSMQEVWFVKLFGLFGKIIAAVLGAILALVLSGDIDKDGRIKINLSVIVKVSGAVAFSIYGGAIIVEVYDLNHLSETAKNFVVFCLAVFGLLIIGIVYQSIELLRGKRLSEVIGEIAAAFKAIFSKGGGL